MPKRKNNDLQRGWLDRAAIAVGDFLGSIGFLLFCIISMLLYVTWNLDLFPGAKAFDPYPFNGMDTVLSMFAIIISLCVLISQNRQRRLEKIREKVEFEVNVKAENEITKMLGMLHEMQKKMGIRNEDPELEKMKENTDIKALHKNFDESGEA